MIPLIVACLFISFCVASDTSKKVETVATLFCHAQADSTIVQYSINADPIAANQNSDQKWQEFKSKLRKKTHRRSNTIVTSDSINDVQWKEVKNFDKENKQQ